MKLTRMPVIAFNMAMYTLLQGIVTKMHPQCRPVQGRVEVANPLGCIYATCRSERICDLNATCDRGYIARTSVACRTGEGEKKYIYIYIYRVWVYTSPPGWDFVASPLRIHPHLQTHPLPNSDWLMKCICLVLTRARQGNPTSECRWPRARIQDIGTATAIQYVYLQPKVAYMYSYSYLIY